MEEVIGASTNEVVAVLVDDPAGDPWHRVEEGVPLDRRRVWVWGHRTFLGFRHGPSGPIGVSRASRDCGEAEFDIERRRGRFDPFGWKVTHWQDIVGPGTEGR